MYSRRGSGQCERAASAAGQPCVRSLMHRTQAGLDHYTNYILKQLDIALAELARSVLTPSPHRRSHRARPSTSLTLVRTPASDTPCAAPARCGDHGWFFCVAVCGVSRCLGSAPVRLRKSSGQQAVPRRCSSPTQASRRRPRAAGAPARAVRFQPARAMRRVTAPSRRSIYQVRSRRMGIRSSRRSARTVARASPVISRPTA